MFDQSTITEVKPPAWDGAALHLRWTSTAPAGTPFQVYVGGALAWHGVSRWVAIPMPSARVRIDIGAVGPGEETTDFSAMLPAAPSDRARLSWQGGSYLDASGRDDLAGFWIHGAPAPGAGVDYSRTLAEICAYPGGILTDGYALGGFGQGGFGRAAAVYQWSSGPLESGTWSFAVVPFDAARNPGTAALASVTISAAPRPPQAWSDGARLKSTYNPATGAVTLQWQPSPTS